MAEHLPLIPDKGDAVCSDVRPVLREVFKEFDYLPPLAPEPRPPPLPLPGAVGDSNPILPKVNHWIDKYNSDRKDIWTREGELQQKYAERIFRKPLPNIFKLYPSPKLQTDVPSWKTEQGILERRDLIPSVAENANVENVLWVQNIFNRSSGDLSSMLVKGSKVYAPVSLKSPNEDTLQSISIGELVSHPKVATPPFPYTDPQRFESPRAPECIISVPPQIDFINYTVGILHSQNLRLVNVSNAEVRLSVRPPSSPELKIELAGTRGLTVTSGAAAEIRVHYRPQEVHVVHDEILVRVSTGAAFIVPVSCYMQPPVLHILIPAVNPSLLSLTPGNIDASVSRSTDCVELGARLLGDVHSVPVLLSCAAEHAAFLLLTEDAWLDFSLDAVTSRGSLVAAPFVVSPALWRGGGTVRGTAWCRAAVAGLAAAALRVLCCTAVVRPLYLLADALYFDPQHISLEAHEKTYDICSEEEPACEYFVHLGTAFPHRALSAAARLVNHSPVVYSYYWSVRPWGVCSCWENGQEAEGSEGSGVSDDLCVGAKEARDRQMVDGPDRSKIENASYIRVEAARGSIAPRAACAVHVSAPDVGAALGVRRAVLMLILKDIPRECLLNDQESKIIKTDVIESEPIPGVQRWSREICEVVCAQMEVWWEVAPVRFVLDPPVVTLNYSRRITAVEVPIRATQLFGSESIPCSWRAPGHVAPAPGHVAPAPPMTLTPTRSCELTLHYTLPLLPNAFPETDVISLVAAHDEWQSQCTVTRQCATRHPALGPPHLWLGVVPPGHHMHTAFQLVNDTYQHICWWAEPFRWCGENPPRPVCRRRAPCVQCREDSCTCPIVRPARGALAPHHAAEIVYDVHAPLHDCAVCTVVQARRTGADVARAAAGAGHEARAVLVSYRVLAPRLALAVLPCAGDQRADCRGCAVATAGPGGAVLRPAGALAPARRACYQLRFTNLTPLPTTVTWDTPLEEDVLKVFFVPKQFDIGSYAQVEMKVVLEARKVCGRRLFVHRARVNHSDKHVYLVIDTAIAGIEISCEVPLGGGEKTDSVLIMRRTQKEVYPWDAAEAVPRTPQQIFAEEDRKRAVITENICHCKIKLEYVEPKKIPRPPPANEDDYPPVEIVREPPPKTRLCPCFASTKPILVEPEEAYCLQFHKLPLRTVRSRTVTIRNESALSATWTAAVRNWPRRRHRSLHEVLHPDEWTSDPSSPGVAVQCEPSAGVLRAGGRARVRVRVRADCWGLFRDQLLIQIENLEPIVLDVWIEAVGAPLQFALNLADDAKLPILCWLSAADPERSLRVKNISRTELALHTYTLSQHGRPQDALPFRVYVRLYDAPPLPPPPPPPPPRCLADHDDEHEDNSTDSIASGYEKEMDTGVELYLAPDYGIQDDSFFKVTPESTSVAAGSWLTLRVTLLVPPHGEAAPAAALLLRARPLVSTGEGWFRPEPPPLLVRLRRAAREGRLQLSSTEIRIKICALSLPIDDVMRVRKPFRIQNVGNGSLEVSARTAEPWAVVLDEPQARGERCKCKPGGRNKERQLTLNLMPRSSLEVSAEVAVHSARAWPPPGDLTVTPHYDEWARTTTNLTFYDDDNVLKTLPLTLELEYPKLTVEPTVLDFGFVTDGDTRKSYYSIIHSSRTETLELVTEWVGGDEFRLWPETLTLKPGCRGIIYIQYTARWCGAPAEGRVRVRAACGAGAWCRAAVRARAAPARGRARRARAADHTDDTHLLPPAAAAPR